MTTNALRARIWLPLLLAVLFGACGGRRPPLPDIAGSLPDVILRAALAGDSDGQTTVQPLMLDTASFGRLGVAAGGAPLTPAELQRQVTRPFRAVAPADVLECPIRAPCRLADGGVYVEVWQAEPTSQGLDAVVTRVFNVQDLHVMTRSVTHRLALRRENGVWRLARLDRLPS
jgi:hypothetical protein